MREGRVIPALYSTYFPYFPHFSIQKRLHERLHRKEKGFAISANPLNFGGGERI
jgi:hypothetical protein